MWVGGQALRRDGKTLTIDEATVMNELEEAVRTYYAHV